MIPTPDSKKIYDLQEAREKIRAFCVYRERSQREVRDKLYSYGLKTETVNLLLSELIQDNYLNEERFACAFVRGKFNIKKWGRNKIKNELFRHYLSDYILKKAFAEIDEEKYLETLALVIEKKWNLTKISNAFQKKGKVANYIISRGFEPDLVWSILKEKY